MPYQNGSRLPAERANKLGHLEVVNSELVNRLVDQFVKPVGDSDSSQKLDWQEFTDLEEPLRIIFCVDGSLQTINNNQLPKKELSFVKTALLTLDQASLDKLDPNYPHPFALKKITSNSAIFHSTVFPLKGISLPDQNNYDAVRSIIYESLADSSLDAEPLKTLKWLAYEKWTGDTFKRSPSFECPHCNEKIDGLPYDTEVGTCPKCTGKVFISDMVGFHLDMQDDSVPATVATAYMLIHETLMLFSAIKFFWENKKFTTLSECLFLKDGPLSLNSQYSKLVIPIRRFFEYAQEKGITIHMAGQEKSGRFVEHLQFSARQAPSTLSYFIPSNDYIDREIRTKPNRIEPYGLRVNYGNKLFVNTDKYHQVVLSIPTGPYKDSKCIDDFIGARKIISTIVTLVSHRHEGALVPIQLANGIASLSTYPSAQVLKLFASRVIE